MRIHGVLVLVVVLGCGPGKKTDPVGHGATATPDAAPAGPELPADLIATFEAELTVFEKVAAAAQAAGDDCDKMAADILAIAEGPDAAAIGGSQKHPDYAAFEAQLQETYAARVDAAVGTLVQATAVCEQHAALDEALEKLGLR